jgi:hypothetical protein
MSIARDQKDDRIRIARHNEDDGITIYDAQNEDAWICSEDPVDTDAKL